MSPLPALGGSWSGGGDDTDVPYTAAYSLATGSGDDPGTVEVRAFDNAGRRTVADFTVRPDGSAPETSIACGSSPCTAEPYPRQVAVTLAALDDAGPASTSPVTRSTGPS